MIPFPLVILILLVGIPVAIAGYYFLWVFVSELTMVFVAPYFAPGTSQFLLSHKMIAVAALLIYSAFLKAAYDWLMDHAA
jgi:hypothetical protein